MLCGRDSLVLFCLTLPNKHAVPCYLFISLPGLTISYGTNSGGRVFLLLQEGSLLLLTCLSPTCHTSLLLPWPRIYLCSAGADHVRRPQTRCCHTCHSSQTGTTHTPAASPLPPSMFSFIWKHSHGLWMDSFSDGWWQAWFCQAFHRQWSGCHFPPLLLTMSPSFKQTLPPLTVTWVTCFCSLVETFLLPMPACHATCMRHFCLARTQDGSSFSWVRFGWIGSLWCFGAPMVSLFFSVVGCPQMSAVVREVDPLLSSPLYHLLN